MFALDALPKKPIRDSFPADTMDTDGCHPINDCRFQPEEASHARIDDIEELSMESDR